MNAAPRFDALDGLRGLAALFVVLHHALSPFGLEKQWLPHAHLAVDFFFALSGFVIASAYEQRLRGGFGTGAFMRQRVLRLWPLTIAGLLCGLAVQAVRAQVMADGESWPRLSLALLCNALWLPDLRALLGGGGTTWPLNVALWSLSTEMGLSLAFGALLYRCSTRTLGAMLLPCALAMVALAITLDGVHGGHDRATWWVGPVRGAYPFIAGLCLWRWHASSALAREARRETRGVSPFWAPALLLAMFLMQGLREAVFEAVAALAIVPAIVALGARTRSSGRVAALNRWLGRLSFPLYALHYPVVHLATGLARRMHWDNGAPFALVVAFELAATTTLALVAAKVWDEPLRRALAARWSRPAALRAATGA